MGKRKNVILPPELPPDIGEDEIEVSDEDIEFVKENRGYAGFLNKLDTKAINKHVTRVADHKEYELESLYERRNQKASLKKLREDDELQVDRVDALPIKTLGGELQYRTAKDSGSENIPNKNVLSSGPQIEQNENSIPKLSKAEKRQKLKQNKKYLKNKAKNEAPVDAAEGRLHSEVLEKVKEELSAEELFGRKRIRMAEIGTALLEDPESNIKSVKELLQFCDDKDPIVVKLVLKSLMAVFKDIVPGYRIRLATEKEMQMTVSKEVRRTRFYESTLLHSYKAYLQRLIKLEKQPSFHLASVRCMCVMLEAVPHFNFRQSLLAAVVKNISSADDTIRRLCCEAVKSLFSNEGKHGGEATIEAVRLIADLVKDHDCVLHPDSIEVFCSLSFDEDLGKSEPIEEGKFKHKKRKQSQNAEEPNQSQGNEKKKNKRELCAKIRDEVLADYKAVSFVPDPDVRRKMQSETLSAVFETYFRILKHSMSPVSRPEVNVASSSGRFGEHPLLAPCLTGLGKFSHLIDLDYMGDLMGCLKKLAGHHDSHECFSLQSHLSVSERLHCCIVAFRVMRNNLDALNVDLQDFFVQLYNLLLVYRPDRDKGEVLAEALQTMLCEGKQHDMQRAAAFIKRLATFSLCVGSAEAMAAFATLRDLLQKNNKCRNLLENDAGGGSLCGLVVKYQPDATDPNMSGALASVLWELSLLAKHYNPIISSAASSISTLSTQIQGFHSTASPIQAYADFSIERELFKPISKPASLSHKRKTGSRGAPSIRSSSVVLNTECSVDEDEVRSKWEEHFTVHRDIAENERLRRELNRTMSSIRLYEEYKRQRKKKDGSKKSKRKTVGKLS